MDFLRSKELKDAMHFTHELFSPSSDQAQMTANRSLDTLLHTLRKKPHAKISDGLLNDTQLLPWLAQQMQFMGSRTLVQEMIQLPLTRPEDIQVRQDWIRSQPNVKRALAEIAPLEKDVLWALDLPDIQKAWPMPILFPCWPVVRQMNRIPWLSDFYQIYRLYISPSMNLLYPASIFFGPWWYLKHKLKWNISLATYTGFLTSISRELFKIDRANLKQSFVRILTFSAYILLYVYTIVQSIDIAVILHRVRQQLRAKLAAICAFVKKAGALAPLPPPLGTASRCGVAPIFNTSMTTMYNLWTSNRHREYLKELLQKVYMLDVMSTARSWLYESRWSFVQIDANKPLTLHKMKHPVLPAHQKSNPLRLSQNLIVTGPNAAGKTTYVKSILCNVLLSQTFGVAYAAECTTPLFHTLSSFMCIHDEVGRESLFEAEVHRCLHAIQALKAAPSSAPHRALVLLDEPMHSTPPIEGAASAMAFIKQISEISGVTSITTTHFFPITALEKECPRKFINISFDAHKTHKTSKTSKSRIHFTYRVRKGPSFQCIAIDLLRQKEFPEAFILDAIKFKNKICP